MTSKNKNNNKNNKNNEKNDMERFDLGDVLSLPDPTPAGAPYPRDVSGVKGVAAFIRKLYAMVSAEEHPQICWSPEGTSLIVQDPDGLAEHVLGQYFKHNNFSSFIRQLNLYRFSKVTSEARIEFFNDGFRRGQLQLLRHIKRSVKPSASSSTTSSSSGASASGHGCGGAHRGETDKVMEELKSLKRQRDQLQADVATLMNVQSATDVQLAEVARENEALRAELSAAVRVHQSMVSTVSTIMELVTSRAPSLALTVPSELSLESLMENTGEARPAKRQRHLSSILPKQEGSSSFELASPPPSPTRATMGLPTRPLSSVPLRAAGSSPSRPPPPRPSLTIPFSPPTLDSTTTLASSLLPSPSPSSILSTSASFFTTTPTSYAAMAVSPIGILGALPPAV